MAFVEPCRSLRADSGFSAHAAGGGAAHHVRTPVACRLSAQTQPAGLLPSPGCLRRGGAARHGLQLPAYRAGRRPGPSRAQGGLGRAASGALGLRGAEVSAALRPRGRRGRRCCGPAQPVWVAGGGRGRSAAGGRGRAAGGAGRAAGPCRAQSRWSSAETRLCAPRGC